MTRRYFLGLLGLIGCKDELEDMDIIKKHWWLCDNPSGGGGDGSIILMEDSGNILMEDSSNILIE